VGSTDVFIVGGQDNSLAEEQQQQRSRLIRVAPVKGRGGGEDGVRVDDARSCFHC
jgi:hypothetical protein